MDDLFRIFITWNFMFFCLGISAITFVIRKVLEFTVFEKAKNNNALIRIWRDLVLPIMPVLMGAAAGILSLNYPYPEGIAESYYGRLSFGLVAGLFSTLVYRVLFALLKGKLTEQNMYFESTVVKSVKSSMRQDSLPDAESDEKLQINEKIDE